MQFARALVRLSAVTAALGLPGRPRPGHRAVPRRHRGRPERARRRGGHAGRFRCDALFGQQRHRDARESGYPSIVVPGGFFANVVSPPFPAGFNALPGPAGVTFSGRAFSEPRLIGLAYAFEQATRYRVPPASTPPLPGDVVIRP